MKLYFQSYPDLPLPAEFAAQIPLIIIPGLFGSTSNWRSFAKQLSKSAPVIIIDQRNHGRSPHADTNSYADLVGDLLQFCEQHELARISLCGHSMGGKVAMLFALAHPARVHKLMVLDIAPVAYQGNHAVYLEALMKLDLSTLQSRREADRALCEVIADTATRLFLLQSLSGGVGSYSWRLNIPVLHSYMDELSDFPNVTSDVNGQSLVDSLFVAGEQSDYLLAKHHSEVIRLFPKAKFASVEDAGHWLHAEQPQAVLQLLEGFLVNDN